MMVKKRKDKKKWLWWGVGAVVLVVVAVIVGVVIWQNNNHADEGGDGANNSEEMTEAEKQEVIESGKNGDEKFAEEEVEKKKVVQYEGDDPNTAEGLTGAITYAAVTDGTLMIRVSIDQYVTEGNCELVLERGGSVIYNNTARVRGDVSTSTCEGFDVPAAELGSGNVGIVINMTANGKSGTLRGEVGV